VARDAEDEPCAVPELQRGGAGAGIQHPELGDLTIWGYVETLAGHDLHHLRQLQWLLGKESA